MNENNETLEEAVQRIVLEELEIENLGVNKHFREVVAKNISVKICSVFGHYTIEDIEQSFYDASKTMGW